MSSERSALTELLTAKQQAIVARWRDAIIRTYPEDTAKFLTTKKDRFSNPVGYSIVSESEAIFAALLSDGDIADCAQSIDNIVRIRAVQDLTAAQATCFIYLLKDVIAEVIEPGSQDLEINRALHAFYRKIDQLALLTFDTYMHCRDQVHQIRAGEKRKWGLQPGGAQLRVLDDKEKRD